VLNFGFFAARALTDVFAINKKLFKSFGYAIKIATKSQTKEVMCTHICHFLVELINVYTYAKKHTGRTFEVGTNGREWN